MMSDERDAVDDDNNRLRFRNDREYANGSGFRSYLQLMRLPAVFTAMADVAMGFLFVQSGGTHWSPTPRDFATLAALLAASSLLYLAGMVLNDVFDVDIDRRQRPERPIPSGRIPLESARRLGWRLLLLGVAVGTGAVFFTDSLRSGVVAAILATAVLLYDAWLKRTPLGPVGMGACRMLNVLLGMSAAAGPWHAENWLVAGAIGVYVAGITLFARREAEQSSPMQLGAATVVMLVGVGMLAFLPHWPDRLVRLLQVQPWRWYMLVGAWGLWMAWRCQRAVLTPTAARVRMVVAQAILSLIMLDALACYATRGLFWATMILLLLVPAVFLGRWIKMT
jgi:4-hydroxybenzoate polyprenyltransferase